MIQFDTLISEGVYNLLYTGGMGNIPSRPRPSPKPGCWPSKPTPCSAAARFPTATTTPPRVPASSTRTRWASTPRRSPSATLIAVPLPAHPARRPRAAVPFPDTQTIEYPDAEWWRTISEKRIKR